MAEKQYISPIRLFDHLGVDYTNDLNTARIKKHLAAEFSMSKDGFIEIDGRTYNRNDVMEEVDRPDFSRRLVYHHRIWKKSALLGMLEDNKIDIPGVKADLDHFQNDPDFDEFFSPYFAGPFNYTSRSLINDNDLFKLGDWLAIEGFVLPAQKEEAFKSIRIFLDDNLRLFRNINQDNYGAFRSKLIHWFRYGWHRFMNNLPEEFHSVKEDIVVHLINHTVRVQRTNREDSQNISNELVQVYGLPENIRKTIEANDKVFNARYEPSSSSSSSGGGSYWWVLWVVIAIVRLAMHGGCN